MPLNIEKLYARFQDINESIARLRQLGSLPIVDFAADQDKLDVASFRLIVATEAAIDICLHTSAKLLKKVPDDYAGCFKLLADQALIDQHLYPRVITRLRQQALAADDIEARVARVRPIGDVLLRHTGNAGRARRLGQSAVRGEVGNGLVGLGQCP